MHLAILFLLGLGVLIGCHLLVGVALVVFLILIGLYLLSQELPHFDLVSLFLHGRFLHLEGVDLVVVHGYLVPVVVLSRPDLLQRHGLLLLLKFLLVV